MTARFVDVGALVQSSVTNQTSNQPVVTIADMTKLRVDVYVEQRDVPYVHVGDMADVADGANAAAMCGHASLARPISSIRARARCSWNWRSITARTSWCRAAFAYVTLHVPVTSYPEIPVAALITRGTNTFVADVGRTTSCTCRR